MEEQKLEDQGSSCGPKTADASSGLENFYWKTVLLIHINPAFEQFEIKHLFDNKSLYFFLKITRNRRTAKEVFAACLARWTSN